MVHRQNIRKTSGALWETTSAFGEIAAISIVSAGAPCRMRSSGADSLKKVRQNLAAVEGAGTVGDLRPAVVGLRLLRG